MGFGTRFRAAPRALLKRNANPMTADGPEAIWHEFYDTQLYTSAATTRLTYFNGTNVDATLNNMPSAGQLPDPQYFSVYDITLDFLGATAYVATGVSPAGLLNDYGLILMVGRPTWTLVLADKRYGPYSLSALHGTGGPKGVLSGTFAAGTQADYAHNNDSPGWNYFGSIIIPPKQNFFIELNWGAAVTLTQGNPRLRIGLFGILSRRTV